MFIDIRRFDVYRKIPKDLTQPTYTGALISLCSGAFIIYLFVAELMAFITPSINVDVYVDDPAKTSEKVPVLLNISFFKLECQYLGIDVQDSTGRHEVGLSQNILKLPLNDSTGIPTGCRLEGFLSIAKVPGNFHISTHSAASQPEKYDFSHHIHYINIGHKSVPKVVLDSEVIASFETLKDTLKPAKELETHEYHIRVVPTVVEDQSVTPTRRHYPYQYLSVHRAQSTIDMFGNPSVPAVYFRYDMLPLTVKYLITTKPLYHFLTNVCAIVGGTFTVAGIIDSLVFSASEIVKKAQMGKLQ